MPNLQSNDKLLFTMESEQSGQTILNTCVLTYLEDIDGPDDYEQFASAYLGDAIALGGFVDQLKFELSENFEIQRLSLQLIYPTRYRRVTVAALGAGERVAVPIPVNSAMTITKVGAEAARWAIGSWHQAGLPVTAMESESGEFTALSLADVADALGDWFIESRVPTGMHGNVGPCLWSPKEPNRVTRVKQWIPQRTVRTMHRRTVGLGI